MVLGRNDDFIANGILIYDCFFEVQIKMTSSDNTCLALDTSLLII